MLTIALVLAFLAASDGFFSTNKLLAPRRGMLSRSIMKMSFFPGNGKVIVTGVGSSEEDEFLLTLLSEQNLWEDVVLIGDEIAPLRKRFLTRSARYSGLLNVLNFAVADLANSTSRQEMLNGADAWLAFNLTQPEITPFAESALSAGVKRAIFTLALPPARINDTVIPEFDSAISEFEKAGGAFTGIRHGTIIEGNEDNPYEIMNATYPCLEDTVEIGVLQRVVAELLKGDVSKNKQCGVCSSSQFAAAYLNILRSSGLSRQQEVEKLFAGGVQKAARLTVNAYEAEKNRTLQARAEKEQRKLEIQLNMEERKKNSTLNAAQKAIMDDDEEALTPFNEKARIKERMEDILQNVWISYDTRMLTKFTSKSDFFKQNEERARAIATKELREEEELRQQKKLKEEGVTQLYDKVLEVKNQQLSKLVLLETKELNNQKQISDTWVKYIYLLLEFTMQHCENEGILFHNMDEFQQTMLLRKIANKLRENCNLPSFDVVYDPLDAATIVEKFSSITFTSKFPLPVESERSYMAGSADDLLPLLNDKYGSLLKNVAALRGAQQIIDLAIETLKQELPPPPPSVREMRLTESAALQKSVKEKKIEAIKRRGQPFEEGDSLVGTL